MASGVVRAGDRREGGTSQSKREGSVRWMFCLGRMRLGREWARMLRHPSCREHAGTLRRVALGHGGGRQRACGARRWAVEAKAL